jgi:MFS transporter, DHA2 family, multidrug resistance protein
MTSVATEAGAASSAGSEPLVLTSRAAILLLGFVGAIKTTGATLATVSLVDATKDLGLSPFVRSASAAAISLAIAATAIAAGVAADRFGRRLLLMWSYLISGVANLAIFLFPSDGMYLIGLIAAGLGYGAMITGSYAYMKALAPGRSLGWGLGLSGVYTTIVCTVTTLLGAALALGEWRWLFLVAPAMCAISAALTPRLLPPMPRVTSGPISIISLVVVGLGLVFVVGGLSQATAHPDVPWWWLAIIVGAALLGFWAFMESRSRTPTFPIRIFKSRIFLAAVIVGLAGPIATSAMSLSVSDAVQYLAQGSEFGATLALEPFFIAGGVGGLIAGRLLSTRFSARQVILGSSLIAALGFLVLLPLHKGMSYWAFLPGIAITGAGIMAALTAQSQVVIQAVTQKSDYGAVTSSRTSISQLGSSLGMILTLLLMQILTMAGLTEQMEAAGISQADAAATLSAVESGSLASGGMQDLPGTTGEVLSSFGGALHTIMGVCAVLMVVAGIWAFWLMRERRPRKATA